MLAWHYLPHYHCCGSLCIRFVAFPLFIYGQLEICRPPRVWFYGPYKGEGRIGVKPVLRSHHHSAEGTLVRNRMQHTLHQSVSRPLCQTFPSQAQHADDISSGQTPIALACLSRLSLHLVFHRASLPPLPLCCSLHLLDPDRRTTSLQPWYSSNWWTAGS